MSNNIKIDNDAIRNQASRLNNLTKRISALDSQFSRLYWQTGSLDVWRVMQSNVLYKRNKKIKNCVKALNATAEEFERLERTHNSGGLILDGVESLKSCLLSIEVNNNASNILDVIKRIFPDYSVSELKGEFVLAIQSDYASMLLKYFDDKGNDLFKSISECDKTDKKIIALYDWFQDEIISDIKTFADMRKDIYGIELPEKYKNSLDILKYGDLCIETIKKIGEVIEGDFDGLGTVILNDGKEIFKIIDKGLDAKRAIEYTGIAGTAKSVLIDTIFKMPKNWIEGIKNFAETGEGTAGTVVFDTTVLAITSAVSEAAEPYYKAATAAAYPVIDQICESFGYDLSAEYEKLTGKTGLDAVFTAQKELWVDTIGMGIRDKVSAGIDKGYEVVGNLWNASIGKLFK